MYSLDGSFNVGIPLKSFTKIVNFFDSEAIGFTKECVLCFV